MPRPRACFDHCLVTGASSGLGWAFAEALASRARWLTLTARREDRLLELAAGLEQKAAVRCRVVALDLAAPGGASHLVELLRREGRPAVDLLINNAGFGWHGAWGRAGWETYDRMFRVNMIAPSELLHGLWDQLTERPGRGAINVASTAAFQPIPWFSAYSATKSFVRSVSLALAGEARRKGTRILTLCPGPTRTEFGRVAGTAWRPGRISMSAEQVVRSALAAYERGRRQITPGFVNWLTAFFAPRAPLALTLALSTLVGRKAAYGEN